MEMSQWLYDILSVFSFITLMSILAFMVFFMVRCFVSEVNTRKQRRKYYNSLDLEQRKVIDGYEDINVPIFPRNEVKEDA